MTFTQFTLGSTSVLLLGLSACFPEATIPWEEPVEEEVIEETEEVIEETMSEAPFGEPRRALLTEVSGQPLVDACAEANSGLAADLLAGLSGSSFGVGSDEIQGQPDEPFLQDGFALAAALISRDRPMAIGCIEEGMAGEAYELATGEGAVGPLIRHAARILGDDAWQSETSSRSPEQNSFSAATQAICGRFLPDPTLDAETGKEIPPDPSVVNCGPAQGALPEALEQALAPVLWAIHDGVVVRMERDVPLSVRDGDWWRNHGGKGLLASTDNEGYNAEFEEDRSFLSAPRGKTYGAAAAIADAVQSVDWAQFRGQTNVSYDFQTPAGWIRVRGSEDDQYDPSDEDTLLLVDLGGNDRHYDEVASNKSGANSVSIVVDLSGDDTYSYPQAVGGNLTGPRLPLDDDGTVDIAGKVQGASASLRARQGAARNGIAMLFDLGAGEDQYIALRASQGYAHQGVGVLFDDGGRDLYLAEDAAQGAAQFGIGLSIDIGRDDDVRRSSHASQGFGYVAGVGILFDEGGNDSYECHPDHAGNPAYEAPQLPGEANASMCQGAGLGFRIKSETHSLAGGIGMLIDGFGDDQYRAGVYAQGVGYWQGFGLLSDGAGNDLYDGLYYAQGAAAHFGVGFLADGGDGADRFNTRIEANTFVMAAAQDFSVGVLINEGGDDFYQIPPVAAGAASCGSVTLFIDNGGIDEYTGPSPTAAGAANVDGCGMNTNFTSTSLFLDVGGQDIWNLAGNRHGNDAEWAEPEGSPAGSRVLAQDVAAGDSGVHVGRR